MRWSWWSLASFQSARTLVSFCTETSSSLLLAPDQRIMAVWNCHPKVRTGACVWQSQVRGWFVKVPVWTITLKWFSVLVLLYVVQRPCVSSSVRSMFEHVMEELRHNYWLILLRLAACAWVLLGDGNIVHPKLVAYSLRDPWYELGAVVNVKFWRDTKLIEPLSKRDSIDCSVVCVSCQ